MVRATLQIVCGDDHITKLRTYGAAYWRSFVVLLSPIIFSPVAITGQTAEFRCAYVILLMATYWVTEALPLAVTAMIPVFAFPLLGILSTQDVCQVYFKDTTFMFMGGLMMAVSVEHSNLHKRMALFVIIRVGQSPSRLLAGFMITTTFLSMWINNTATAAMLVPIVDAVSQELSKALKMKEGYDNHKMPGAGGGLFSVEREVVNGAPTSNSRQMHEASSPKAPVRFAENESNSVDLSSLIDSTSAIEQECTKLRKMFFLGVAFTANIGGTGSPLGCGPNLVVFAILQNSFGESTGLNFATWMLFNVPGMILCAILGWCWLHILFGKFKKCRRNEGQIETSHSSQEKAIKDFLIEHYRALGPVSPHETVVLVSFTVLIFLWIFRAPGFTTGWAYYFSSNFENNLLIRDATPVMLILFLLFCIPVNPPNQDNTSKKPSDGKPKACLTWEVLQERVPWGILLLLGGGLAMAEGAKISGLSAWLGQRLRLFANMPKGVIVFLVTLMMAMVTEVASNTATASVILPILKDMALGIHVNPLYLMLPAAVCCAYAFMLPVATPGNAIILTASGLSTQEMIKAGLIMNVLCVFVINFTINTLGVYLFDLNAFPSWAINATVTNGS